MYSIGAKKFTMARIFMLGCLKTFSARWFHNAPRQVIMQMGRSYIIFVTRSLFPVFAADPIMRCISMRIRSA